MNVAVVCANGRVGQLVVKEAVDRGMEVTAIARGENKSVAPRSISKDVFDLTADDLSGFDAVVDARDHSRYPCGHEASGGPCRRY